MGLFNVKKTLESLGLGPKSIVGIDIGSSSVKICELSSSKKSYKLTKFAIRPLPESSFFEGEVQKQDEVTEIVKELVDEIKPKSSFACVGIWGPNVISKRIQVGEGSLEDLGSQVEWELEQYVPFDLDEATTDFHIIGENDRGNREVLAVTAKTDLIENFMAMVNDSGLEVKIIDSNQIALANIFSHVYRDEMDQTEDSFLIIEIGASLTNIIVCRSSIIVFSREVFLGGNLVTEKIKKSMGVTFEEAEELKVSGDQNGNLPEEIISIINESFDSFVSEIKPALDFYYTSSEDKTVKRCYITGGSSLLPGLADVLSEKLKLEVLLFDPFEKIDINDNNFNGEMLSIISSAGISVLGLAMRDLRND